MTISCIQESIKREAELATQALKLEGVVGSRHIPYTLCSKVGDIVEDLLSRHYHIATGGAIRVDQFVIERLLRIGRSNHCTVYSPWQNYAPH